MMLDIWLWLHLRWRYQITETQYCVFGTILAINAIPMWKQLPDWLLLSKVFTGTLPVMEGDRDNQGPMKLEDCYRYFVYSETLGSQTAFSSKPVLPANLV